MKKHVFISYSKEDVQFVSRLEAELKENDYEVWRDRSQLRGGQEWVRKIQQALDEAWAVVVVETPDAKASEWVSKELIYAENIGTPIIPILLKDKLRFALGNKQYVDMRGHENDPLPDEFYEALLQFNPPNNLNRYIDVETLQGNTGERLRLIPDLKKIAQNPKSPNGQAARELLEELTRDPDELVRSVARTALGLTATSTQEVSKPATPTPPQKPEVVSPPKNNLMWIAAGIVGLAIVIALGIYFAIRDDGTDEKEETTATQIAVVTQDSTDEIVAVPSETLSPIVTQTKTPLPPSETSSSTPTVIPTDTSIPTYTPSNTSAPTDTPTPTDTPSHTPSNTPVPTDTPTVTPTPTLNPNNILFIEDFEDEESRRLIEDVDEWEIVESDGVFIYRVANDRSAGYLEVSRGEDWKNYSFRINMKIVDKGDGGRITLRSHISSTNASRITIELDLQSDTIRLITTDVLGYVKEQTSVRQSFPTGRWLSINFEVHNDTTRVFMDGRQVLQGYTDPNFELQGTVALGIRSANSNNPLEVYFDEIIIYSLNE